MIKALALKGSFIRTSLKKIDNSKQFWKTYRFTYINKEEVKENIIALGSTKSQTKRKQKKF